MRTNLSFHFAYGTVEQSMKVQKEILYFESLRPAK